MLINAALRHTESHDPLILSAHAATWVCINNIGNNSRAASSFEFFREISKSVNHRLTNSSRFSKIKPLRVLRNPAVRVAARTRVAADHPPIKVEHLASATVGFTCSASERDGRRRCISDTCAMFEASLIVSLNRTRPWPCQNTQRLNAMRTLEVWKNFFDRLSFFRMR